MAHGILCLVEPPGHQVLLQLCIAVPERCMAWNSAGRLPPSPVARQSRLLCGVKL
jgi:hypothetical protein